MSGSFGAGSEQGGSLPGKMSNIDGHKSVNDSAGIKDGLSMRSGFNAEDGGMSVSTGRNPVTGNPLNRVTSNPSKQSVSNKGKSFDIC